jgi:hypothetical protein
MKPTMFVQPELARDAAVDELLIEAWKVEQLCRLGLSQTQADAFADVVDWHDVAALVARGCPPELALEIAR